jgi:hypothetical protein
LKNDSPNPCDNRKQNVNGVNGPFVANCHHVTVVAKRGDHAADYEEKVAYVSDNQAVFWVLDALVNVSQEEVGSRVAKNNDQSHCEPQIRVAH